MHQLKFQISTALGSSFSYPGLGVKKFELCKGVALWQIYIRYGLALVGALGGMIFFSILSIFQGKILGYYRGKVAESADERIKLLGELVRLRFLTPDRKVFRIVVNPHAVGIQILKDGTFL